MMDPFSAAAGIAGLISLGIQVKGSLVKFYTSYKDQEADVTRTTAKLQTLLDTFQLLQAALQSRTFQPNEQDLIKNIEFLIQQCDELIQELEEECKKCEKTSATGVNATIRATGRRAAYPFRQSTMQKLDEAIGEILQNLSLALDVLQLQTHKNTQDDIAELKSLLEVARATQISATIRAWLNAPDATINHNAACAKRQPGTGIWFVKGSTFKTWLTQDSSFLWLNGFAGCGKSVLCSTAIQYTFRHKRSDPGVGIAFFYFTFNDESKQDDSAMLRSLILQLSGQLSDPQTDLARLHDSYSTSIPPATLLISHLRQLVQKFDQVYILLDALDESQREQVLDAIETMRNWSLPGLHVLVTSRDEPDIRDSLSPSEDEDVTMRNAKIDQDISYFISGQLNTNRKLRKLRAYHDRIQKILAERSQGVFRWVECQLKSLMGCPQSEYYLDQCLQSLPRTLDETYERILCSIDKSWIEDARRILTLLCFSSRPLAVQELIDAVAIQLREPAGLNLRRRLHDADDFRLLCPGLIDVGVKVNDETHVDSEGSKGIERMMPTLCIAHFSIQEYLESDRIRKQQADAFALESASAHAEIAEICLVYLLEPGLSSGTLDQTVLEEYPLARFAARFWYHHYTNAGDMRARLDDLVFRVFQQRDSFYTCMQLHDLDKPWETVVQFLRDRSHIASPVYYASLLGLDEVLYKLINTCQEHGSEIRDLINARGGSDGNALQAASMKGHDKIVQILVDAGADVNSQHELFGSPLRAASLRGYDKTVKILIDAGLGGDVNVQSGYRNSALRGASAERHDKIVQMLIDAGADANTYGALQAASAEGHNKIVQMLIEAGADVNAPGVLRAASAGGHDKTVQILIEAGADANVHGVLRAASAGGHDRIVQMLIDAGGDANIQKSYRNNALRAASAGGHNKIVQILIDAGADINAQGALRAASAGGHDQTVQILIDAGADVDAHYWYSDSALTVASERGYNKIVQMLKDAGASDQGINLGDKKEREDWV